MSNVLDFIDQTFFLGERATGVTSVLQCVWVYESGVDTDGLRKFNQCLQRGRLSRRIERSPLPFGRHRWVSPPSQSDVEVAGTPRPREQFDAWLVEQANSPIDAEHGPGWRLAALPFTDGGAGVSLVVTHCLTDGVGLCEALADAAAGRENPVRWSSAGSRRRWRAWWQDARQTARDLPAVGRAAVATVRFARRNGGGAATPHAGQRASKAGADERIALPMATIFVDACEWDARAAALGGTSNTLLAAFAARLAQRMGRVASDGSVTVGMPVNERAACDTRANAVTSADFAVDPTPAATDLREIRAATKQALIRHREVPDERTALLPLTPFVPRWLVRQMIGMAAARGAGVVSSNLGGIDPAANRPDGSDANHFAIKGYNVGATTSIMDRTGGILALLSGRARGRVFVSALAYQPNRMNSNEGLRQDISCVLRDFSLSATSDWTATSPEMYGLPA
ncbi:hypothetical protein A5745_02225 [Mycobacterium sp. IS-2888]|uniref:hypothetical protein n=1 Tax=Mycobacterium sp. IS-2888 TaxID=1834159 RepID=UPI00096FCDDD|nr:hypothetical protein [Mycobacterium sp. IS-2888]OMC52126.1 hypothetical protein A5745_02225 [Mycobacterium sp. IS-2888]